MVLVGILQRYGLGMVRIELALCSESLIEVFKRRTGIIV